MTLHVVQLPFPQASCTMCNMNLARIRKARGLSQGDLAEMIGKDTATISRAESMSKTAKLETYQMCAEALHITLADIFCDEVAPIERELLAAFRAFPDDQRGVFVGLIEMAKARAQASDQSGSQSQSK
jgi:transcriptional regulator with XRE-family HTH domain